MRQVYSKRLHFVNILLLLYIVLTSIRNISEIEKHIYYIALFGTICFSLSLILLLSKISMAFTDYVTICVIVVRAAFNFTVFNTIKEKSNDVFDSIDIKLMQDNITFVAIPSFLLFTANWKFDLCFTLPMTLAFMYYTLNSAFDTEDNNMACYMEADKIA